MKALINNDRSVNSIVSSLSSSLLLISLSSPRKLHIIIHTVSHIIVIIIIHRIHYFHVLYYFPSYPPHPILRTSFHQRPTTPSTILPTSPQNPTTPSTHISTIISVILASTRKTIALFQNSFYLLIFLINHCTFERGVTYDVYYINKKFNQSDSDQLKSCFEKRSRIVQV